MIAANLNNASPSREIQNFAGIGRKMKRQCYECGGFIEIGYRKMRCAGCALLDLTTWQIPSEVFTGLGKNHAPRATTECRSWCGKRAAGLSKKTSKALGVVGATGYGVIDIGDCRVGVHRVAYATWIAPIPVDEWLVGHSCTDVGCINPNHLTLAAACGLKRVIPHVGRIRPGGYRVWGEACEVLP